jgi:hypothetical protein
MHNAGVSKVAGKVFGHILAAPVCAEDLDAVSCLKLQFGVELNESFS